MMKSLMQCWISETQVCSWYSTAGSFATVSYISRKNCVCEDTSPMPFSTWKYGRKEDRMRIFVPVLQVWDILTLGQYLQPHPPPFVCQRICQPREIWALETIRRGCHWIQVSHYRDLPIIFDCLWCNGASYWTSISWWGSTCLCIVCY